MPAKKTSAKKTQPKKADAQKALDARGINRNRLQRIMELHRLLSQKKYPNCKSFAKHLHENLVPGRYDSIPDRKTILRDIQWMRDFMGAPIEFDPIENGYFYTRSGYNFPLMQLYDDEFFSLMIAQQMARLYRNTPVAKNIDSVMQKVITTLSAQGGIQAMDPAYFNTILSFHGRPPQIIDKTVWQQILTALTKGVNVMFTYRSLHSGGEEQRRSVGPVHLANINDDWYLLGWLTDEKGRAIADGWRHFKLSRISNVLHRAYPFDPPKEFDPDTYFANHIGKFFAAEGDHIFDAKLRFSPTAAPYILERQWPQDTSTELHTEPDGSVILHLAMPYLKEAVSFCLSYGSQVEVLEPAELRQAVLREIELIRKQYNGC